jgi:hypothetical protein
MMPGIKAMVAGSLKAERMDLHGEAQRQLSRDLFRPAWRFSLFDEDPSDNSIAASLQKVAPCFTRANDSGWWNKVKNGFRTPMIGIIEAQMAPDPSALAVAPGKKY